MLGCIESCHLPSIQFVGVAPQTNTVLKNWFENERLETRNSYRAQQRPRILLSSRRTRISGYHGIKGSRSLETTRGRRGVAPIWPHFWSVILTKSGCMSGNPPSRLPLSCHRDGSPVRREASSRGSSFAGQARAVSFTRDRAPANGTTSSSLAHSMLLFCRRLKVPTIPR